MTEPSERAEVAAREIFAFDCAKDHSYDRLHPSMECCPNGYCIGVKAIIQRHIDAALAERIKHCERCGGDWVDNGLQGQCPCELLSQQREEIKRLQDELQWQIDIMTRRRQK